MSNIGHPNAICCESFAKRGAAMPSFASSKQSEPKGHSRTTSHCAADSQSAGRKMRYVKTFSPTNLDKSIRKR